MISNESEYGNLNGFRPWSKSADIHLVFQGNSISSAGYLDFYIMMRWEKYLRFVRLFASKYFFVLSIANWKVGVK